MIIREIFLEGFKKYTSAKFAFEPGFNCIHGPNESGKSTLLTAIRAAFFGPGNAEVSPWQSTGLSLVRIQYEVEDERRFVIQRDFTTGRLTLTTDSGAEITAGAQIQSLLTTHLGFAEASFFEDIAFVQQAQIAQLKFANRSSDLSNFLPGLERLLNAQKSIRRQLDELDNPHPNVKYARQLQLKETQLVEKQAQYQKQLALLADYKRLHGEFETALTRENQLKANLKQAEIRLTAQMAARESKLKSGIVADELTQLDAVDASLTQVAAKRQDYAKELTELGKHKFPADFDVRADFLIGQSYRLEEATSVHAKVSQTPRRTLDMVLLIVAFGLLIVGFYRNDNIFFSLGILVSLAWVFLFIRGGSQNSAQTKAAFEKDRDVVLDQVRELSPMFKEMDPIDPNFIEIRSKLEQLQKQFRRWQNLQNADNEARIRWEQTMLQLPKEWNLPTEAEAVLVALSARRQNLEADVARLSQTALPADGQNLQSEDDLRKTISQINNELPSVQDQRIALSAQLRSLTETMRGWDDAEGAINRLEAETAGIKQRVAVLKKADTGLQETINRLAAFPGLNEKISGYFSQITDGVYQSAGFQNTEGQWEFSVTLPNDSGRSLSPEKALSFGAQEQFYLAFRLALMDRYPSPLFLDDVLVNFDRGRRKKALDLLYQVSRQRQIILTTHDVNIPKMLEKVAHLIELT